MQEVHVLKKFEKYNSKELLRYETIKKKTKNSNEHFPSFTFIKKFKLHPYNIVPLDPPSHCTFSRAHYDLLPIIYGLSMERKSNERRNFFIIFSTFFYFSSMKVGKRPFIIISIGRAWIMYTSEISREIFPHENLRFVSWHREGWIFRSHQREKKILKSHS